MTEADEVLERCINLGFFTLRKEDNKIQFSKDFTRRLNEMIDMEEHPEYGPDVLFKRAVICAVMLQCHGYLKSNDIFTLSRAVMAAIDAVPGFHESLIEKVNKRRSINAKIS